MEFSSINIQGNIISSETLQKIRNEDIKYQLAADFGLDKKTSVRDEIGISWAAIKAHWTAFKLRAERLKDTDSGTSETRNSWMIPFLRELGYDVQTAVKYVHPDTQKTYAISHKGANLNDFPIHIMGINDDLDKRRENSGPRLSPHALVQEYLNNTDHPYALVTNGRYLRLLRDATRLVRLSYLEVNLEKMMEEDLYADFAVIFRLLHATRMPKEPGQLEESYIEYYHQESLASGQRIRNRLSLAVEESIKTLANGFLSHPENTELRKQVQSGAIKPEGYYHLQLQLIYRLLFLIVTEERNLVFPDTKEEEVQRKRKIYYDYYSVERLRKLAARAHFVDGKKQDLWEGLKSTFLLFEKGYYGEKLGIKPLGSGIFSPVALGNLPNCSMNNLALLHVIRCLTLFENENKQLVRVNYSDLDVEEFGSVYEGLLEYDAVFKDVDGVPVFSFVEGTGRSSSGSHYTPEELVKPLIKHSLEYVIEEKLKEKNKEQALLSIKVCDVACGSGHILLSAARRIALELARVRTNEDQPTPTAVRKAIKDVIRNCIYGVDKNPLAVELCKVALWLEAHNPGEPLNFLDHHIKCGDAIVGLAHKEELQNGIAEHAFKTLPADEKEVASTYAKRNKEERKNYLERATGAGEELTLEYNERIQKELEEAQKLYDQIIKLPETTPDEIIKKQLAYKNWLGGKGYQFLKLMADTQIAQFFIPKNSANKEYFVTDAEYRKMLGGYLSWQGQKTAKATAVGSEKRFFHWFIEFPEAFLNGGFDCILGNPPYLGGTLISGFCGKDYYEFISSYYNGASNRCDLSGYFVRRIFSCLKLNGFLSVITTNSITDGDTRTGSIDYILNNNGVINYAAKSVPWPGIAAVIVSLISICKGNCLNVYYSNQKVEKINSFLEVGESEIDPFPLLRNSNLGFNGSYVFGDGFLVTSDLAKHLLESNPNNSKIVFPYLNGEDLNSSPTLSASRYVINFGDLSEDEAKKYPECFSILESKVKSFRKSKSDDVASAPWWQFWRLRKNLYETIKSLDRVLIHTRVTKTHGFTFVPTNLVYSDATVVIASDSSYTFACLQSSLHEAWSWKYSSKLKSDRRYSIEDCFNTFPLPNVITVEVKEVLEFTGEEFYSGRKIYMDSVKLGLTKIYNLFHCKGLDEISSEEEALEDKVFEKRFGKEPASLRKHLNKKPDTITFNEAVKGIIKLRELHVQMDQAVLKAYGWTDIDLKHDFYEVDYLPENDRVRFTIHPNARKEILKRLLQLNHKIHQEEVEAGLWDKKGSKAKKEKAPKSKKVKVKSGSEAVEVEAAKIQENLFAKTETVTKAKREVTIGSCVTLKAQDSGEEIKFRIVANPKERQLVIGYENKPLTDSLCLGVFNRKEGVVVEVEGRKFEIVGVG